jgi:regulator of protease activity HflC (stomatin/prohibitin superfamily)
MAMDDLKRNLRQGKPLFRRVGSIVLAIILLIILFIFSGNFYYVLERVQPEEIGVQFSAGRIKDVVGPGLYSDFGLFVELEKVSTQAIPFKVTDPELITRDKQRIGLVVSGDIFRPGLEKRDILRRLWPQYRGIYLQDDLTVARVEDLAKQSMKVCVGDRTFDDAIIGQARDDLRTCIDDELDLLVDQFGLNVANLVVPDVVISEDVQAALDAIVRSRLETEKAAQDQLKAQAEAAAEQARQEGEIRVEQSRIQEQTRQQTLLAELERERLAAQQAVIEAERANDLALLETERAKIAATKANDLLAAQRDLEINEALAEAAVAKAQAETAVEKALAELYAQNPQYVTWLIAQANASALTETDKLIFTSDGTTPTIVLPGPGIQPTVDTTPVPQ